MGIFETIWAMGIFEPFFSNGNSWNILSNGNFLVAPVWENKSIYFVDVMTWNCSKCHSAHLKVRLTHSFRGNYSRAETIQMQKLLIFRRFWPRKLFKGGNYSRAETIRGNTVCIFDQNSVTKLTWWAHGRISKIFFLDHFSSSFLGQKC